MHQSRADITALLAAGPADPDAQARLLAAVYDQLRLIARSRMAGERKGHTLDATGLVHEAFVRLLGGAEIDWQDRAHFYRTAAQTMQRILVDHARARGAEKRGGGRVRLPASIVELAADDDPHAVLMLDDAIGALAREDERAAEIVRLRFYAGLGVEAVADLLGVSDRTIKRQWSYARARLYQLLSGDDSDAPA
ncbi:MAG: sigma-70 family RNA polymerase sigma factor [Phycisphaeraceae bacterium]|nr:sigma-70 family RNA polymerase sigma factor [Phycisphaeraceae bacterium]MCW5764216.1 sigma-70 family RNA polymerase sigma factor [Phycisphaeraceae bacterium]